MPALTLVDLLRVGLEAKGFAEEEKEGERLVLSRKASDQVKPSPVETVSTDSGAVADCKCKTIRNRGNVVQCEDALASRHRL